MKAPNADFAIVNLDKLRSYVLDPSHRVGRHKARLFAALLHLGREDAEELRQILLDVVTTQEASLGQLDEHGQRYRVDFALNWRGRQAQIRSVWIVRSDEDYPRLLTCYPLREVKV